MVPMIAENPMLENGGCSLVCEPSKYKRRRVSAVRDFPPGCGPNAPQVDLSEDEAVCCIENGKDTEHPVCDVERKKENCEHGAGDSSNVESKKTSCDAEHHASGGLEHADDGLVDLSKNLGSDHHASSNGVVKTTYVLTGGEDKLLKAENADDGLKHVDGGLDLADGELVDLSKNLGSDHIPVETGISSRSLSEPVQVHTEYVTKESLDGAQEPSKDLMEVELDVPPGALNGAEGTIKETIDIFVTEEKMVAEGDSPPHHPIPSTILWKERNYPPRRRVSAVRHFPAGCGTNLPLHDNCLPVDALVNHRQMTKDTGGCESNKPDVKTTIKESTDHINDDIVFGCQMADIECGTSRYDAEAQHESDKDASGETNMQPPASPKEQLRMAELQSNEGEKKEQLKVLSSRKIEVGASEGGDGKEVIVYKKDKGEKKRATVYPGCNTALQTEKMDCSDEEGLVVVHALMASVNCPWQQGQRAVNAASSSVGVKGNRRKKCIVDKRHKLKPAIDEAMEDAVEGKEESMDKTRPSRDSGVVRGKMVKGAERDSPENAKHQKHLPIEVQLPPFGASSSNDRGTRNKVRETLRLFQVVLRKLLQEQETKPKEQRNGKGRIDLKAAKILKDKGKYINAGKAMIGPIPGIEVGDEFHYRVELMMIGLHRQSQAGIDTVKVDKTVLATSIVASGGYDNDVDNSDVLTFSGQGGNMTGGDKEPEDQKLERGNLALKNSIDEKNVVRVIRGVKETKPSEASDGRPKVSTTYTYDGLYTVERYWQDIGQHGKKVYKFELKRLPGQPELAWKEVKKSKKFIDREGRCVDDISGGKEPFPICAINTLDDEKPPPFTYITRVIYPDWCNPLPPQGCDCKNGCSDSGRCACVMKNGGEIPFNFDGAIVEAKPLVFECSPSCKCPASCHNRVSQHGMRFQLEIFKTKSRGWGVRCLSSIPSGSFICEYIGELLEDKEAEQKSGNDEYLFDIGQNFNDHSLWEGLSGLIDDGLSSSSEKVTNVGFTIDAVEYGNLGRFINHSCSPNLYAQNVLYDHDDRRIPHIMFFAAENIPPLQELTYHYNYAIGQVFDKDGREKVKNCYCGSSDCTGRMY